jgi:hypothetical protein
MKDTYPPMKMEQTECSETSAYKIQTPGNYPKESIQQCINSMIIQLRDKYRCCTAAISLLCTLPEFTTKMFNKLLANLLS